MGSASGRGSAHLRTEMRSNLAEGHLKPQGRDGADRSAGGGRVQRRVPDRQACRRGSSELVRARMPAFRRKHVQLDLRDVLGRHAKHDQQKKSMPHATSTVRASTCARRAPHVRACRTCSVASMWQLRAATRGLCSVNQAQSCVRGEREAHLCSCRGLAAAELAGVGVFASKYSSSDLRPTLPCRAGGQARRIAQPTRCSRRVLDVVTASTRRSQTLSQTAVNDIWTKFFYKNIPLSPVREGG